MHLLSYQWYIYYSWFQIYRFCIVGLDAGQLRENIRRKQKRQTTKLNKCKQWRSFEAG